MKWLFNWLKQYRLYVVLFGVVNLILALTVIAQNVTIAVILDRLLFNKDASWFYVLTILAMTLLLRATLMMFNDVLGERLSHLVRREVRYRLLHQQSSEPVGAKINIATETIKEMLPFFRTYLPQFFKSTFIPFVIILVMFGIHWPSAVIMLVTAPFIPLFYIIFGLKTRDAAKDQMTFLNQFSQRFVNLTRGLVTLKLFQRSDLAIDKIEQESTQFRDKTMVILRSAFLSGLMLDFISMLGIGLVALEVGLSLIVFKNISFLSATIAFILAPEFYNAMKDLGQAFHVGKESEGASDIVRKALDEKTVEQPPIPIDAHQQPLIEMKAVSYRYPHTDVDVIQDVSGCIHEGDHIAIVGPSGAGKTTLVQLLIGERTLSKGTITYAKPLNIGYLSQQPYIFNATIAENITLFKETDESAIETVLKQVALSDKVAQLKKGIYTMIGEGGEMLSGGEMRRIELARVLLLNPDLIVLDEPTTGLDIETEQKIQETLQSHFSKCTTLTIAHRQEVLNTATRRWYIDGGKMIKDDTIIKTEI